MGHRLDVTLRPGEAVIANGAVRFPSGQYKRVWGFRSFLDFQGRDISARLPGWPPSKKATEPPAKASVKGVLFTTAWVVTATVGFVLGALIDNDTDIPRTEPGEGDDFQVLSADPGTLAFGAPWQLDPGRNKAKPRVVLHMTDRRLLFTDPASGALLWEVSRRSVRTVTGHADRARITFVDDSWLLIGLVTDNESTVPDRAEEYVNLRSADRPMVVPLTVAPNLRFFWALEHFAPAAPTESPSA